MKMIEYRDYCKRVHERVRLHVRQTEHTLHSGADFCNHFTSFYPRDLKFGRGLVELLNFNTR